MVFITRNKCDAKNYIILLYNVSMNMLNSCSSYSYIYRAAAWIGYYQLLPEIIGYFPYSFRIHELWGANMYGNNDTFYGQGRI